ncbi:MAG: EAL domain-containing protein [Clostridia bacterium]|nr:EAL domain-containing protein [Clostridia bacterium]
MTAKSKSSKSSEKLISGNIRRAALMMCLLFLIAYIVTVVTNAADFFEESADTNALRALKDDLAAANTEMDQHYQNLEEIALHLAAATTKEEVDAVLKEYIGSDPFGDLRYYVGTHTYAPDGSLVTEDQAYVAALAEARNKGASAVYLDPVVEKDCVAFYLPLPAESYADGILSIVPARDIISMRSLADENLWVGAIVTPEGKILATEGKNGLGLDLVEFLDSFTADVTTEMAISRCLRDKGTASFALTALDGTVYRVAVTPVTSLSDNASLVTFREQATLVEAEMTFIRHIVIVLIIAVTSLVLSIVYSVLYHRQAGKALADALLTDAVLECPNAEHFRRRASGVVYSERRDYAVIVMGLRHYRPLADTLGEAKTHEVLKGIAKVLDTFCSGNETYGYAGDGRFLLLDTYTSEKSMSEKLRLLGAIINKAPILKQEDIKLRFQVGVYLTNLSTKRTIGEMIDCATVASETVNTSMKKSYVIYSEEVNRSVARNEQMEAQMESALLNGEFKLFLQPKYSVKLDKIHSAEALVRWFDPEKGEYMFPTSFISLFEANGFIVKLDQFIYIEVLKYLSQAAERGEQIVPISVNVSRVTAMSEDFLEFYIGNKKKYAIGDNFLTLELTESFAMENFDKMGEIVDRLHRSGIRCSIDDFGSGYSSFSILKNVRFDELKLDSVFLTDGLDRERDDRILETVIQLAKAVHMDVVQEGVETEDMFRRVSGMGCDLIQGYYYAKAIPVEEYRVFIKTNTSIVYKAKVK